MFYILNICVGARVGTAWASPPPHTPHKQFENDVAANDPNNPVVGELLLLPSCQGPNHPGRICTEPSRAGVRC